jgi:hypothetical protein
MTYTDYCLKAATAESLLDALVDAFGADDEGQPRQPEPGALVLIGALLRDDGTQGEGFHADLRIVGELPEVLADFVIPTPVNRKHRFC